MGQCEPAFRLACLDRGCSEWEFLYGRMKGQPPSGALLYLFYFRKLIVRLEKALVQTLNILTGLLRQ